MFKYLVSLHLAGAFGREVIAEGVETVEHGELLLQMGCELAQGYGIARPMPAANLPAWAENWRTYSQWANLKAMSRNELPLLFTQVEHHIWLKTVRNYLAGQDQAPPPDTQQCRFMHWLDTQDCKLYAGQAEFVALQTAHQQLHALAAELFLLKADKLDDTVLARHAELDQASEVFFQLVKMLIQVNSES